MTVLDLEKLEQSPPRINPRRKNLRVVNNRAMAEFGQEAFNVDLGYQQKEKKGASDKKVININRLQRLASLESLHEGTDEKKP